MSTNQPNVENLPNIDSLQIILGSAKFKVKADRHSLYHIIGLLSLPCWEYGAMSTFQKITLDNSTQLTH